jgi:hypothetical protein
LARCKSFHTCCVITCSTLLLSPNILALNWASTLVQSLLYLLIFMVLASLLLWYFARCTARCAVVRRLEGHQTPDVRDYGRAIMPVTFLLAILYLPLSTMALHVLVWSKDLWVVPNIKVDGQAWPPTVEPLGPADEYRDALDFCWTTTMKRNEINWAPVLIVLAVVTSCAVG